MGRIKLRSGRVIGDGERPYIIAEMNSSHNGKVERAIQMIDAAKECGCDCVKFQSWTEDTLYSEEYYAENPVSRRLVKGFSLKEEQLYQLWEYSKKVGIDFSSTPYSDEEADFLVDKVEVPFVKIASMEIDHLPFLTYIAEKGVPIVLSTGMSGYDEIEKAVETIARTGNRDLCILHCVSVYPAEPEMIHLNNILYLKEKYPDFAVGYSDHTMGSDVACGAVALGTGIIEKHFTLDRFRMGMDNHMATEPEEMREFVQRCQNVYNAMGSRERILSAQEKAQAAKMRRSIIAKADIEKGAVIESGMLDYKRPGTGISPARRDEIIGKKMKKSIKKGFGILEDDFEQEGDI